MRFPRSLVGCFVVAASGTLAYGQSVGPVQEPQLGPIVVLDIDASVPSAPRLLPFEPELGPIILIEKVGPKRLSEYLYSDSGINAVYPDRGQSRHGPNPPQTILIERKPGKSTLGPLLLVSDEVERRALQEEIAILKQANSNSGYFTGNVILEAKATGGASSVAPAPVPEEASKSKLQMFGGPTTILR